MYKAHRCFYPGSSQGQHVAAQVTAPALGLGMCVAGWHTRALAPLGSTVHSGYEFRVGQQLGNLSMDWAQS